MGGKECIYAFSAASILNSSLALSMMLFSNEIHSIPKSFCAFELSLLKCSAPAVTSATGMRGACSGKFLRIMSASWLLSKWSAARSERRGGVQKEGTNRRW